MKRIISIEDKRFDKLMTKELLGNSYLYETVCFMPESYYYFDRESIEEYKKLSDIINNDLNGIRL